MKIVALEHSKALCLNTTTIKKNKREWVFQLIKPLKILIEAAAAIIHVIANLLIGNVTPHVVEKLGSIKYVSLFVTKSLESIANTQKPVIVTHSLLVLLEI